MKKINSLVIHSIGNRSVLTWGEPTKETGEQFTSKLNLLDMYQRWSTSIEAGTAGDRFKPPVAFFDSLGPYFARAAGFVSPVAVIFAHVTDRKVGYEFVFERRTTSGLPIYVFCPAQAEKGLDSVIVSVELPTEEMVFFHFHIDKTKEVPIP